MRRGNKQKHVNPMQSHPSNNFQTIFQECIVGEEKVHFQTLIIPIRKSVIFTMRQNRKNNNNCNLMMSQVDGSQFILIYYNIRGKMQVIRNLMCYLGISFVELHLELIEAGLEIPQDHILSQLKSLPIDRTKLPLLVHGNQLVYGTFAINLYICNFAHRLDLFGTNDAQRREVQAALEVILQTQMKSKTFLFQFAEMCLNKSEREVKQMQNLTFENFMTSFPFVRECCEKLEELQNRHFILGSLTIVDFYFMQSCFYILGIFGCLDKDYNRSYESFYNSIVSRALKGAPNKLFLETMRQFTKRISQLPYYSHHKTYLESFPVIYSLMSQQKIEGLRKVWVADSKYIY